MKKCSKCKTSKPIAEFTKDARAKDGLQRVCRQCHSSIYKARSARYEQIVVIAESKKCNDCQRLLPSSEFYQSKKRSDGLYSYCKPCSNKRTKVSTFKLSQAFADRLFSTDAKCEVCDATDNLVVDHDHSCCGPKVSCGDCVRGILCRSCNLAEGQIKNIENAMKLVAYLKRYKK